MYGESGCPHFSQFPYYPDLEAWKQLANHLKTIFGQNIEAIIEEDNRYIIKSICNSNTAIDYENPLYLRLRLWQDSREIDKGKGWVKVDYLVISPPLRGQGLGIKAVELIKNWIQEQHLFSYICLYARSEVSPFWFKCGFTADTDPKLLLYSNRRVLYL
jgi:GNAT superfamily N-acetyltransferase